MCSEAASTFCLHADELRGMTGVWRHLAVLALVISAAVHAGVPEGSIEDFIAVEMPASGVPGLAYAVVADGQIASAGAHGVVTIGGESEVTPDTPFATGSISKSFTALAVMQLVEAGDVDLDTVISEYLDAFSSRPAGAITIRQLLSHTSGFSTLQGNASHTDVTGDKDELERLVVGLADVDPAYEPDDRWEYSNTNYQILGRLIEAVSGQAYQAYVAANILDPVGMEHSFVADGEIHQSMATGHRPWFGTIRPQPENRTDRGTAPQGGIVASAGDLARYMMMMMNGEDDVLSANGKALMMRPASDASPFYGFGWFLDSGDGSVSHSGSTPGFETLATMIPTEKKGVVVLVNGGSGLGFGETTQLRNGIIARALGLEYEGEGSRWSQKALFIGLVLLPIVYVLSMVWAWLRRATLRAKLQSGAFGLFSVWFPLLTTLVAAWVLVSLTPGLAGAPLGTVRLFQPDFGLALIASAVTGVLWAVFRVTVAYTGKFGDRVVD
jgi:CubicO group peptidase (beta-lactamase class C family)